MASSSSQAASWRFTRRRRAEAQAGNRHGGRHLAGLPTQVPAGVELDPATWATLTTKVGLPRTITRIRPLPLLVWA